MTNLVWYAGKTISEPFRSTLNDWFSVSRTNDANPPPSREISPQKRRRKQREHRPRNRLLERWTVRNIENPSIFFVNCRVQLDNRIVALNHENFLDIFDDFKKLFCQENKKEITLCAVSGLLTGGRTRMGSNRLKSGLRENRNSSHMSDDNRICEKVSVSKRFFSIVVCRI